MRRKIIAVIMLITGIAFVLYPIIGNIINVMKQNSVQDEYNAMVCNMNTETKNQIKDAAAEYNQKLAEGQLDIISTDEDEIDRSYDDGSGYTQALNAGNDVLAIIKIPKIVNNKDFFKLIFFISTSSFLSFLCKAKDIK